MLGDPTTTEGAQSAFDLGAEALAALGRCGASGMDLGPSRPRVLFQSSQADEAATVAQLQLCAAARAQGKGTSSDQLGCASLR